MSHFHQAIVQLIEQINDARDDDVRCIRVLAEKPTFELIDWLDAQPVFPKFYWQSRDNGEETVALGQLYTFTNPAPAYQILGPGQRVWGGRSFDGRSDKNRFCLDSFFFLPQVELIRREHHWELAANISRDRVSVIRTLRALCADVSPVKAIEANILSLRHTPEQSDWKSMVSKALAGIQQHQFKKVVLARQTTVRLAEPISAAQLLKPSIHQNHNSFHFLLTLDSQRSFVGSTPERLYLRQERALLTEALAGTIGRGQSPEEDARLAHWLMSDTKNLNENQYVVDDILERISPFTRSLDTEPDATLVRLSKVQHLRRQIRAELKNDINGGQLLGALQPTAAVAGLPREEAKAFISENEPFARGWYAGSVGYISHQQAEFCVAIRSAMVMNHQVHLYAGAGIVPGSVAEHEWQELDKKVSTLLSLITERQSLGVAI